MDTDLKRKIVESQLRMIFKVCKNFSSDPNNVQIPFLDLIQEANIGLCRFIKNDLEPIMKRRVKSHLQKLSKKK